MHPTVYASLGEEPGFSSVRLQHQLVFNQHQPIFQRSSTNRQTSKVKQSVEIDRIRTRINRTVQNLNFNLNYRFLCQFSAEAQHFIHVIIRCIFNRSETTDLQLQWTTNLETSECWAIDNDINYYVKFNFVFAFVSNKYYSLDDNWGKSTTPDTIAFLYMRQNSRTNRKLQQLSIKYKSAPSNNTSSCCRLRSGCVIKTQETNPIDS